MSRMKRPKQESFKGTKADQYFKAIVNKILREGSEDHNPRPKWEDGTPAHTISINGFMCQYDISKGESPFLTLRPVAVKTGIRELFWIYQDQSNNLDILRDKYNVHYWDSWDVGDNTIGFCYGETVRYHDLMNKLLEDIEKDPDGRRHIINLWQVDDFDHPHGLKPCCMMLNFNVRHDKSGIDYLDMALYQRSCDFITAASSINPVQYYALQCMVAYHFGYSVGIFTHFLNNIQIYDRHMNFAKTMTNRKPIECHPKIVINPDERKTFYELTPDDLIVENYPVDVIKEKNPNIKLEVAI